MVVDAIVTQPIVLPTVAQGPTRRPRRFRFVPSRDKRRTRG
jgi:hypothetical protein